VSTFSHSKIQTFETCPLQYKYAYIDNIKVEAEDTVETFLGSRVHETLEKLYRDKLFEKHMDLEDLLAFYNKQWEDLWKETIIIVRKDYTQDNYRKMGERYLEDYYNRYGPFDHGKVIGLETKDILPLSEDGKYLFHIRIDRLMDMGQGLYEVHDYKTSTSLPAQEALDQDRQLAMYALWVSERFKDCQKVRLVWHFLAFDKEMESFRTKEQLEDLRKEVLEKIKEIEATGEFPPRVSNLCDWCFYNSLCPMWKHEAALEEKPENEYLNDPGLKLVDQYVKIKDEFDRHKKEAEEKLQKLKEALITFCQREEVAVVFGSDKKITVSEFELIKFPPKNTEERKVLLEILKRIGKLDEVLDLDVFTLGKVLRNKEWGEDQIAQIQKFISKEKSYRLTIAKKK